MRTHLRSGPGHHVGDESGRLSLFLKLSPEIQNTEDTEGLFYKKLKESIPGCWLALPPRGLRSLAHAI